MKIKNKKVKCRVCGCVLSTSSRTLECSAVCRREHIRKYNMLYARARRGYKVPKLLICEICAIGFEALSVRKKTCGPSCRKVALRRRLDLKKRPAIKHTCSSATCGAEYMSSKYNTKYCSRKCYIRESNIRNRSCRK